MLKMNRIKILQNCRIKSGTELNLKRVKKNLIKCICFLWTSLTQIWSLFKTFLTSFPDRSWIILVEDDTVLLWQTWVKEKDIWYHSLSKKQPKIFTLGGQEGNGADLMASQTWPFTVSAARSGWAALRFHSQSLPWWTLLRPVALSRDPPKQLSAKNKTTCVRNPLWSYVHAKTKESAEDGTKLARQSSCVCPSPQVDLFGFFFFFLGGGGVGGAAADCQI